MNAPVFIDARQVVAMLDDGIGVSAFLAKRARLEEQCGFPLPCPAFDRPLKWRRDAVAAWIAAQGYAADDAAGNASGDIHGNAVRLAYARDAARAAG